MPINLNALGLIPSAPYNVSLTMNIGDKEIDSLRSFSVVLPPIFNQDLSNYAPRSAVITKTFSPYTRLPRAHVPSRFEGTTVKVVSVSAKLSKKKVENRKANGWWGYLNGSSESKWAPRIDVTFKFNKNFKNATFLSPQPTDNSDLGMNALFTLALGGSGLTSKDKELKKKSINTANITGFSYVSGSKSYWFSPLRLKFFNVAKSKGAQSVPATLRIGYETQEITARPGVYKLTSGLSVSIDPALVQFLTVDDNIKDVVYFLYSDSNVDVPDITTYRFINDDFFEPATGADVGALGWTAARGTFFKSGNNYSFPRYNNGNTGLNSFLATYTRSITNLSNETVFTNENQSVSSDGRTYSGEVETAISYPQKVSIAFVVVRYVKRSDGNWDKDWTSKDSDGKPIMSSPATAGIIG